MKKIFLLTMVLLVAAAVAGAGTFAYFSDTQTSSGNTFTSGTFDIALGKNSVFGSGDSVSATWASPTNWKPGDIVTAKLSFTNKGSIESEHVYFKFYNLQNDGKGDGSNLMNAIIVTQLKERFNNTTTSNQAANIESQVGDGDGVLTLAEFAGWMTGRYGYFTVDDQSNDNIVLAGNDQEDYDFILEFQFDPNAGNEYQGDTCSFDLDVNATQYSPTEGLVKLHQ